MTRDVGGTGFVGLNDYLGANQGVLDAGYAADTAAGHQQGDTLQGYIGQVAPGARSFAAEHGTEAQPGDVAGYTSALTSADQARETGRKFGSEFGLAGSAANPVSGEQGFNAALAYGAHGADYKTLGDWLTGLSGQPEGEFARGNAQGMEDYRLAHPPLTPLDPHDTEPHPPGSWPPGRHDGGPGSTPPPPRPGDHR